MRPAARRVPDEDAGEAASPQAGPHLVSGPAPLHRARAVLTGAAALVGIPTPLPRPIRWARVVAAAAASWAAASALRGARVPAVVVARREVVQRVVASGRALAPATIPLASVTLAQVSRVLVVEGDRVRAGQLLVQLDEADASAAVEQARGAVKQAAARLDQVRSVVSRVASEAVQQAGSRLAQAESRLRRLEATADSSTEAEREDARHAVEQARSQYDAATAQALAAAEGGAEARLALATLAQARAAERAAEAHLNQTRIRAPADGVVLDRRVEPGEVAQPARTLLVLARDGPARLSVQPDERSLALLAVGQAATVVADAFPGRPFPAEVSYIAPSVDAARGTVEIRLTVPRPPSFLRTDMTVSVNVDVARHRAALVLPADAVRDAAVRPWVLAVKGGRAVRQEVELGARGEDLVQILGGLSEGDPVVPPSAGAVEGKRVRPDLAETPRSRHVL